MALNSQSWTEPSNYTSRRLCVGIILHNDSNSTGSEPGSELFPSYPPRATTVEIQAG